MSSNKSSGSPIAVKTKNRLLSFWKKRIQSPLISPAAGADETLAERVRHPRSHKILLVPDEGIVTGLD